MSHPNARLTPHTGSRILRHRSEGHTASGIAAMMGVSRAAVYKWLRRYQREGMPGLSDRPSRPRALVAPQGRKLKKSTTTLSSTDMVASLKLHHAG